MPLWTQPVDARDAPEAAFREVYADPVAVNGVETTVTELVGRARSLQRAFDQLDMHILDTVEAPDRVVIAFLMRWTARRPVRLPLGDRRADAARHRGAHDRRADRHRRCHLRDLGRLRRSRPAAPARCGQAGVTAGATSRQNAPQAGQSGSGPTCSCRQTGRQRQFGQMGIIGHSVLFRIRPPSGPNPGIVAWSTQRVQSCQSGPSP